MQQLATRRNIKGKHYTAQSDEEAQTGLSPILDFNGWPVRLTLDAQHLSWTPVNLKVDCLPIPLNLPSLLTRHVAGCQQVGPVEEMMLQAQERKKLHDAILVPVGQLLCANVVDPVLRNAPGCCGPGGQVKVHQLEVKYYVRGPPHKRAAWHLKAAVFESLNKDAIEAWADVIQATVAQLSARPKKLLVVVNPYGGAGAARNVWSQVNQQVFKPADISCTVMETQHARHAVEIVAQLTAAQLTEIDGIVAVGGDGLFHEVINGMLRLREHGDERAVQAAFVRIGHIPAGSTDAVCYSLHGHRGFITAGLHIALGDRTGIDVARVESGDGEHCYAVTMAAYGYLGDLMRESEGLRWMGPLRYEVVGAKTLFKGKTYRATVGYLPAETQNSQLAKVCGAHCTLCKDAREAGATTNFMQPAVSAGQQNSPRWVTVTDDFVAIKLLIPSCRSNKSPKGVAPYNHLCDGKGLLVLVRRCNQLQYAQFLFELSQVGACSGRFPFVDLVDVTALTVTPVGEESSWNIDGELCHDNRVAIEVHGGLIDVFARGPDL